MSKKIKEKGSEFKLPRLIISICFVGLFIAYILILTVTKNAYNSPLAVIIMILAGVLLATLGIVIKMQERKVDLDYDSTVVWKMCVVLGVILVGFSIVVLIV